MYTVKGPCVCSNNVPALFSDEVLTFPASCSCENRHNEANERPNFSRYQRFGRRRSQKSRLRFRGWKCSEASLWVIFADCPEILSLRYEGLKVAGESLQWSSPEGPTQQITSAAPCQPRLTCIYNRSPKGSMWSAISVALLCRIMNWSGRKQSCSPKGDKVL